MIHAEFQLAEDVLLGVLGAYRFHKATEIREIAAWCRDLHAIIESHDVAGQRSAPGIPCKPNLVMDDVLAGLQIINPPHPVPDGEHGDVGSGQYRACVEQAVILSWPKLLAILAEWEEPFALTNGIIDEGRETMHREEDRSFLIGLGGLSVRTVSARHQHTGIGPFPNGEE